MLDSHIRHLLDTVFKAPPGTAQPDLAALRKAAEEAPELLGGTPETVASVSDASTLGESCAVALRVYRPETASALPLLLYAHGGGWVTGSLDSHDRLCRMLANRLPTVVVAVNYRCAPEHAYPAALDDFEAAWHWARARAIELGADGMRFVVAGDSSGGNLAAALMLRLRAAGAALPDLQLLLYPALDATCSRASYRQLGTGYNLTGAQMAWYWEAYRAGTAIDAMEFSPLAADDLSDLPVAVGHRRVRRAARRRHRLRARSDRGRRAGSGRPLRRHDPWFSALEWRGPRSEDLDRRDYSCQPQRARRPF
jgi:acetyl esterase/lipase